MSHSLIQQNSTGKDSESLERGVTVIVPVYNVEKYVEHCINSIFQSNLENLRVIAVDDHGNDSSMSVVYRMAQRDPRIKIVTNDCNRGLAFSRNHGLSQVTTTYLAFLDSDDWVAPNYYDSLLDACEKYNADIAVSNVVYAYEEKGIVRREWVSKWNFKSKKKVVEAVKDKQFQIYACACWNKLYRTSFLRKNNVVFPENLFLEDVPFTFLSTVLANRIALVNNINLFYRQRSNSIMQDLKISKKAFDIFKIIDICYAYLNELPQDVSKEYFQVLDNFQILDLNSWYQTVCESDKDAFKAFIKERFSKINLNNNPYVTAENRSFYNSILDIKNSYKAYLFGFLPLGHIAPDSWIVK